MIIAVNGIEKAKQLIKKSEDELIIVTAQDDIFNRKMLEYGRYQILLSPEKERKKHTTRQMDSGLNHVLAKIAAKNKVAIGIDLNSIKKLKKGEKAARLARIKQNIITCRKAKARLAITGALDREARLFLLSLGASSQQTKQAIVF